jgi:CRISPR-associated protein Cas2
MRNAYIISYDITDPKRLRKVFKTMYGFGNHIQLSVFRCELSDSDKVRLVAKLTKIVKHDEDQVLFIDIGPASGRAMQAIESVGRAFTNKNRVPVVV